MSIFIHRCPECGHGEHEHEAQKFKGRSCSFGWCPCSRVHAQVRPEPSVLIPTFNATTGADEGIIAPGTTLVQNKNAGLVSTCACDQCKAAYAEATGIPA